MKLDSPERLKALVKPHVWHGDTLHFRKLSVAEWRRLSARRKEIVGSEDDAAGGLAWGALVLSKMLCDGDGKLTDDSDGSRLALEELANDEMFDLLKVGLVWSGIWAEKADADQKKS